LTRIELRADVGFQDSQGLMHRRAERISKKQISKREKGLEADNPLKTNSRADKIHSRKKNNFTNVENLES